MTPALLRRELRVNESACRQYLRLFTQADGVEEASKYFWRMLMFERAAEQNRQDLERLMVEAN